MSLVVCTCMRTLQCTFPFPTMHLGPDLIIFPPNAPSRHVLVRRQEAKSFPAGAQKVHIAIRAANGEVKSEELNSEVVASRLSTLGLRPLRTSSC
jgi:hypothetical protein